MPAAHERLEFAPPPAPGRLRALALAVLAHLVLLLALTWGITWNRESQDMGAEAELWASVPQEAAPRPAPAPPQPVVQAPPVPPPVPPEPKVEPPAPQVAPPAPPKQPDIALEREKRRQEEARREREEAERQKKLEARRKQEEMERQKKAEARRKQEEQEKRELAEKKKREELAEKKREELAKAKAKQEAEAKRLQALREENLKRLQSLASGTGGPNAAGTAARSAGPSDSYAGRIRARVKPNIVFTDDVPGNPTAEIEVRMAPDGTITSKRVVKSSGVRSWDDAVLRALERTEVLPRDVDGRVHSPLIIEFRPKG